MSFWRVQPAFGCHQALGSNNEGEPRRGVIEHLAAGDHQAARRRACCARAEDAAAVGHDERGPERVVCVGLRQPEPRILAVVRVEVEHPRAVALPLRSARCVPLPRAPPQMLELTAVPPAAELEGVEGLGRQGVRERGTMAMANAGATNVAGAA